MTKAVVVPVVRFYPTSIWIGVEQEHIDAAKPETRGNL